ncbi:MULTISPECIES: tRNA pseudouridine(55) synthase TruB [Brevibacillus]|jgi:tRNA pseudouridine55 synthase|uniref:tRNA pseudouridine synthase B n=1 Tax=Brevibacillus parabrevis TaxID=54914 RepID=A0A4Y3PI66_BREPA|nr:MULTISPECIES: tRNA pseudouridine(55) synthase TruB [Brevibacillus]MBU8711364.1 tRNA pseudouridine(55) synthase TruB [Brevibacillus parabrevis]MDH6350008.1 tRNA pseudouridine55 synthase [Brevibacillus sp. 1238]MDR4999460.1 tRNA pseudouridine(55) synthase TruB [Brevibacillus parabrevis]MED2253979.1 tRNA pseudouridine(55) synthase TruB [Brevibacillus parabrevis]NRQ53691.1 tRNA pseudouridine(55) synthase TruB [Brevibacillus sp. HD1.4A]
MSSNHGVLVIDKPAGMTSHDCVARIRRLYGTKKVGHTGTLDPDVTGVLPICVGNATRLVEYLQELPKRYSVVMRLGSATTTEDASGELLEQAQVDAASITQERIESLFASFLGEIEQVPPMFSAVKVNGKRLYDLAREGTVIERQARKVTLYELTLHEIKTDQDYVDISFSCTCSKGTYMRTLCVDLGRSLGYPAHMKLLRRIKSGPFMEGEAIPLQELEERAANGEDLSRYLVSIPQAISFLPSYQVKPERTRAVRNGLATALPGVTAEVGSLICLFAGEELLGIHRVCRGDKGLFAKAEKVFPAEV